MLTIHTPITLTVNPSVLQLNDNFTERIAGNYKVIGNGLEPEDMLHLVSEPPEVYLAEGGMAALVENRTVYENRSLKLDVINNVLNRILVSDTYRMTYQDKVFVQSVLSQIGVTDVSEFIRQVQNIRQERKNVSRLTDLYWSEHPMLSQLLTYRQEQAEQKKTAEGEGEKSGQEQALWLHQSILNRLQTGAVYQEIRNYLSATSSYHKTISGAEMQISEQTVMAQNILLNKLKNHTTVEEQPLIYHTLNAYEMREETQVQKNHAQTVSQLVQAVLFNALHQMYALRTEELLRQSNVWYQLAGAVYQATENTCRRYDAYHERNYISRREADNYTQTVQQYQKNEIRALEQFFPGERQSAVPVRTAEEIPEAEFVFAPETDEDTEEQMLQQQSQQTVQPAEPSVQNQFHNQQIQSVTRQEALLLQQLEQINQNNIHNSLLLQQLLTGQPAEKGNGKINKEAAKRDALRALHQPEEVLLTYLESRTQEEKQETVARERLTSVFGEETVKIFETLEKYQKTPGLLAATGQVVPDGAGMLLRDIQLQGQEKQVERLHEEEELVQEVVHEKLTRQIQREVLPEQLRQMNRQTQREISRVELLHRQTETTLEEEVLEEIRGLNRSTKVENRQIREQISESNLTQEIVNNRVNEFQTRQNEELTRLIQERVQHQLGDISEQVYGKLEKRMDAERRRRGL